MKSHKFLYHFTFVLIFIIIKYSDSRPISHFANKSILKPVESSVLQNEEKVFQWELVVPFYLVQLFRSYQSGSQSLEDLVSNVDTLDCKNHVKEWIQEILRHEDSIFTAETWALHLTDSWGKAPEGIFSGHMNSLGDYEQCVNLMASNLTNSGSNASSKEFTGRYCTIDIDFSESSKKYSSHVTREEFSRKAATVEELKAYLQYKTGVQLIPSVGTCFPDSCSAMDVENVLQNALRQLNMNDVIQLEVADCSKDKVVIEKGGDIVFICVIGVLFFLCLIGTISDIRTVCATSNDEDGVSLLSHTDKQPGVLICFSLYSNVKNWMRTKNNSGEDQFDCIHGMRFLSMCWVILGHTWIMLRYDVMWNYVDVKNVTDRWTMSVIANSNVVIDTFFTLSGFLVSYRILKYLDFSHGSGFGRIPLLYLHRYLRLTPTLAIMTGFMATVMPYVGNGPNWGQMYKWSENCKNNWWTNLLYVNNVVDASVETSCNFNYWYLANDMQYFIITPILVYPLWKWKKLGVALLICVTLASILTPGILTYVKEYNPTSMLTREDMASGIVYMYPWMRATPYIVGIWKGFALYSSSKAKPKNKLSATTIVLGWSISTAIALAVLFAPFTYFDPTKEIPRVFAAIYAGIHRLGWALVMGWISYACIEGYGGFVNSFLSWKPFIPLSRLTYCVFLVAHITQYVLHLSFRQPVYYGAYSNTNRFLGHLVLTFILGFICSMLIEAPFSQLDTLLFKWRLRSRNPDRNHPLPRVTRNGIYYNDDLMTDVMDTRNGIFYNHNLMVGIEETKNL